MEQIGRMNSMPETPRKAQELEPKPRKVTRDRLSKGPCHRDQGGAQVTLAMQSPRQEGLEYQNPSGPRVGQEHPARYRGGS